MARKKETGYSMSFPDGQIASIALANHFTLATCNIKDFSNYSATRQRSSVGAGHARDWVAGNGYRGHGPLLLTARNSGSVGTLNSNRL
jgi:hypothetical protein